MPQSHSLLNLDKSDGRHSQVNDQLERLEQELDALKKLLPDVSSNSREERDAEHAGLRTRAAVLRVLALRGARAKYLGADLFGEPAWDLLLQIYLAELDHVRLSVSSACNRVDVPDSTALRWVTKLIDKGLVRRYDDQFDQRRSFLALTDSGTAAMKALIDTQV